ncbi:hypothetical protein I3843_12G107800 [Carya illinoinensis]|uniref:Neprosin PEP catalytic domain-containing protein n=1 Tax=Carya illinoinensis TaxID=32201 RepID=A0A922IWI6_CARIL|nr:hypothetical protein I3842_12G107500 [Carya illinoinensis]KAG7953394.1 hypothetical protein I3843_12G107800 [Carya illinoinensis]
MAPWVVDVVMMFFVCFLSLSHTDQAKTDWELTRKENSRFEQQLINLKKSAIESIHEDEDIYECIDFYKQPGFNHPFWKNTTIQMKRKLYIDAMKTKTSLSSNIGLKNGGCPYGTVPIMRVDEDDLARASKINSKIYQPNIDDEEPGHHMDGKTQCFNQQCPGYIQLSSQIPLGWPLHNISIAGGEQYATKLRLIKDYISTRPSSTELVWKLLFDEGSVIIGFWPTTIFGQLSEFGNQADWGGEVYSPLDQPSPAMGTGIRPRWKKWDPNYSAHSRLVAIAYGNSQSQSEFINPNDAEVYESDPKSYSILDIGYVENENIGRVIIYDGPGGLKSA